MKIVCGLGNPGAVYDSTRHNVGFAICRRVGERLGASFARGKWQSDVAAGRVGGEPVLVLLPQTFMNRSGRAVAPAAQFYKVEPDELLVVHDDADLPPGRLRFKRGGGTAGHNGLNSLRENLGHADFHRLRYGIGRPEDSRIDLADFVLAKMDPNAVALHEPRYDEAAAAVLRWVAEGIDSVMNAYNGPD